MQRTSIDSPSARRPACPTHFRKRARTHSRAFPERVYTRTRGQLRGTAACVHTRARPSASRELNAGHKTASLLLSSPPPCASVAQPGEGRKRKREKGELDFATSLPCIPTMNFLGRLHKELECRNAYTAQLMRRHGMKKRAHGIWLRAGREACTTEERRGYASQKPGSRGFALATLRAQSTMPRTRNPRGLEHRVFGNNENGSAWRDTASRGRITKCTQLPGYNDFTAFVGPNQAVLYHRDG